jgi:serine/threonine-protein phosphatase 2B catalytic subunit
MSTVADMLLAILSICSQEELDTDSDGDEDDNAENKEEKAAEEIRQRREQIRKKILAVGKMQRVFSLLR